MSFPNREFPQGEHILREFAERTSSSVSVRDAASATNLQAFQDSTGIPIGLELIRQMAHYERSVITVFGPPGSGKTSWTTAFGVAARQIFKMYGINLRIDYVYYDRTHALRELFLKRKDTTFKSKKDWATSDLMVAQIEQFLSMYLPPNSSHLILAEFVNLQRPTEDRGETIVPRVLQLPGVNSHHVAFVPNPIIQEITKRQRETIATMGTISSIDLFHLMMNEIGLDLSYSVRKENLREKQQQLKTIISKMGNPEAIASLTALLAEETENYIQCANKLPASQIATLRKNREKMIRTLPSELAKNLEKRIQIANMMLYWLNQFSSWNVPKERAHVLVGNTLAQAFIPSLLEEIGPLYSADF